MKTIVLVILSFSCLQVHAIECRTIRYSMSRDLSVEKLKTVFDKVPREALVQMAWGEMLYYFHKDSMVTPILHYLAGTEDTEEKHGYYKTMLHLVTGEKKPMERIKIWPKRGEIKKSPFPLKRLCELYEKTK